MATPETYGALPVLYLDGKPVPPAIKETILRVVVDSDVAAPDACRVVLNDPGRDVLAAAGFDFRHALKVTAPPRATPEGGGAEKVLFEGTIYSLGFGYDERGATAVVVAYDSSYALFNGVHTATYHNVTDSDLVTKIARELSIDTGTINPTTVVHEHVGQVNETHWDFLTRRAREVDHVLRVRDNKMEFVRPTAADDAPRPGNFDSPSHLQLTPGGDLDVFTARVTAAQQVSEVEVRGWDDRGKRELVATARASTRAAQIKDDPADLGAGNSSARYVAPARPLATQAECDAMVAAVAERIASTSVAAEGVAHGDPRILAGVALSVGRTGGSFDGKLTVSHAEHVFDHASYRTRFTVSGPHDRSLLGLASAAGARQSSPLIAGVVPAVVSNINDPESRCRVRVKLPWLSADYETDWARVAIAGGGPDRGMLVLPEVNDEVLVAFEQGDPRRPFVLAGLYNGVDAPPFGGGVDTAAGTVVRRGLRTRKGHEIVVSDADGDEHVEIRTRDGKVRIRLDHDQGGLTIETDADIDVRAKGKLSLTAEQDLTISARGTGSISADAGLTLSSRADVTVQGNPIKLN
ncbi:Rhs element Vgr protein [Parafrankia sp. EAN1pec]|uniref:VgrG-related protein n=1 Tax=Parafrankia sp. (strain EAN1pec) TaxID=298653 RepID=UPI0000542624|nr:Rhs element Vgr protein [Frankia sp. EAN1pec]